MKVTRKPFQIFLIEQLFYPLLIFISAVLLYTYGAKVLVRYPYVSIETGALILGSMILIPFMLTLHVWIPYSCVRLWVSAGDYCKGFGRYLWRGYSGLVFAVLAGLGLIYLFQITDIIQGVREYAAVTASKIS